jgi:small ligand-binding sensory domain FIST
MPLGPFRSALTLLETVEPATDELAAQLTAPGKGGTLGLVYVTDRFKGDFKAVIEKLKQKTGVETWVGTVGLGVIGGAEGAFDQPAMAAMLCTWPEAQFALYDQEPPPPIAATSKIGGMPIALVHVDPRYDFDAKLHALAQSAGAYLLGGLTATRGNNFVSIAGEVAKGGASGVLLGPDIAVLIGVSQGCSAIGPTRSITKVKDQFVAEIDGAPALQALLVDIASSEEPDQRKLLQSLLVGLPIAQSDTGDYVVRNIAGINTEKGLIGVADHIEEGQKIFFCRRDRAAATQDLTAMVRRLRSRTEVVNGALYVSCCARGPNLFGSVNEEVELVQAGLGNVPLVGFYANGEIAGERVYGYTGVLAVF